nr:glycosyltransferase family 1 protein [Pontibacter ruber]
MFLNVQKQFPKSVIINNHYLSKPSAGIFNRLLLCFEAYKTQKGINHITGDVNFIAAFLNKNNTILTIHDIESLLRQNTLANILLKYFWLQMPVARVKWITVVSETTKQKLLHHVSIDPEKVVVIPNVISQEFTYVPNNFNKIKPTILQVGTKYNKNLERTIEALNAIPCTLMIVGKLSDEQVKRLKRNNIEYINKIGLTDEQLREAYAESDIVTFVSLFEGFGMPILEANATGRPVVTSSCSSMPEVAGDAALLVNPLDVSEIRSAFLSLIENDVLREKLVVRGLENVKRFSNKAVAQMYLDLYKKM